MLLIVNPAAGAGFVGWACGGGDAQGGLLLCTTNGTDWFRQGAGQLGTAALSGVAAADGRQVWAVGEAEGGYASIYYSPNAGVNWVRQGNNQVLPPGPLHKIWAVDRNRLWAVGPDGAVVVTDNGGRDWHFMPVTGYSNMLQGVTAVDEFTAWVSGEQDPASGLAGLFYTQDSGQHWTSQTSSAITNADHLLGLYALDANRVWAIGGQETILVTTNAGAQWNLLFMGTLKDGNEICVLDDQHLWAANDSIVSWTTNGGSTWDGHNTPDYTMDVSTPDGTSVWAVSSGYWGGAIYHSADGGANWAGVTNADWKGLFAILVQPAPVSHTLYVDAFSGNATTPYGSWDTAASNIQDAVEAAAAGDLVLVTNGVYDRGGAVSPNGAVLNRVMLSEPVTVRSVNGPDVTVIAGRGPDGNDAVRGAYLSHGAELAGFTITNGHVLDESHGLPVDMVGGGVNLDGSGLVSNCVLSGNSGSAAYLEAGEDTRLLGQPRMCNCIIRDNRGQAGGGVRMYGAGELRDCQVLDNTTFGNGGGVDLSAGAADYQPLVQGCYVAGNRVLNEQGASAGGIAAEGFFTIRGCTIAENSATLSAGGLDAQGNPEYDRAEVINTIVYNNTAPQDANVSSTYTVFRNCCATPLLDGSNNIAADPLLLGVRNPHIAELSPCRGAGDTNAIAPDALDIDGEPRVVAGQTDIGCDQYIATNIIGVLSVQIQADYHAVLTGVPLDLAADVQGKALWQRWLVETNAGVRVLTNTVHVTQIWPVEGIYTVRLEAANLDLVVATSLVVHVSDSAEHYASPDGGNLFPYTNWAMAATSIIEAVETCPAGGIVRVGAGTFREADVVSLTKPLTVLGAGADASARVDGRGDHACLRINHPLVVVSNLTLLNGYSSDQGGGAYVRDGLITHCVVISNYAFEQGGGLSCWGSARVEHCAVRANEAGKWGGGLMADDRTLVRNCLIQDNLAQDYGGGADIGENVELQNSFITGNRSFGGAGVNLDGGGTARNCTIVKNTALDNGGGVRFRFDTGCALYNSIVYHNEAAIGPNISFEVHMTGTVEYTCAWPLMDGPGNIATEPDLLGLDNPHIVAASPCIDAGSTGLVAGLEQDIDGEDRVYGGSVDMGCDEFIGANILGLLTVAIRGETQVVANDAADLFADIRGKAWGYAWTVAEPGATTVVANTFMIAPSWPQAGRYDVILTASNLAATGAATVSVQVIAGGFTNYVSQQGGHVAPYTDWATAATNLQAAIDACWVGGVVLVQTGNYEVGRTVQLAKPVTVRGAGSRDDCVLDGGDSVRVIDIAHPRAVLEGLTVTGGNDEDAAGVYMLEGTVSNCVVAGNESAILGGGIRCAGHSLLTDSLVVDNKSPNWPGGVFCSGYSLVRNCRVERNTAKNRGGGIYLDQGGSVSGCFVSANSAAMGGGVFLHYAGTVTHSIIHSNVGANGAGAYLYWGGVVTNCDITWNWSQFDGGGVWFSFGGLVTDSRIQNNFADENAGTGGGGILSGGGVLRRCDVSTNLAARGSGLHSMFNRQEGGMIDACHIHHNVSPEGWGEGMAAGVKLFRNDEIRNCLIEHNTAHGPIGGLLMQDSGLAYNCTIVHNSAGTEAGGIAIGAGNEVDNCIIYDNTAPQWPNWDVDDGSAVVRCCTTPDYTSFTATVTNRPLFAGAGDYRLQSNSPCVNAGTNEDWMAGAKDYAGNSRIIGPRADIGAYEYPLAPAGLSAAAAGGGVRVAWIAVGGDLGIRVYRSATAGSPGVEVASLAAGATAWTDASVSCGQAFYYSARADYGAQSGDFSAQALARLLKASLDFDGDGLADAAVYSPFDGRWYILRSSDRHMFSVVWGWADAMPVAADYDGDCRADLAVYWPAEARWYVLRSSDWTPWLLQWGWNETVPVPADYDGDGVTDVAVYWPAGGRWYVLSSSSGRLWEAQWGWAEAVPAPADYDGDGKTDLAVYWPAGGQWHVWLSGSAKAWSAQWGWSEARPVAADYDGDGKADLAVYWPAGGRWSIWKTSDGQAWTVNWGWSAAQPVPMEYHRAGVWDTGVYWPAGGNWYMLDAGTGANEAFNWGWSAAMPVAPSYQILRWYGLLP